MTPPTGVTPRKKPSTGRSHHFSIWLDSPIYSLTVFEEMSPSSIITLPRNLLLFRWWMMVIQKMERRERRKSVDKRICRDTDRTSQKAMCCAVHKLITYSLLIIHIGRSTTRYNILLLHVSFLVPLDHDDNVVIRCKPVPNSRDTSTCLPGAAFKKFQ